MSTLLTDDLIKAFTTSTYETENARQAMNAAAARRQEAIFGLHASGISVRGIATRLSCSASVVQGALKNARRRRPILDRREDRISFELHKAVADKLRVTPDQVLRVAHMNLERMKNVPRSPYAEGWIREWETLLAGDPDKLVDVMLGTGDRANDLRQVSPFAGVLSQDERLLAIRKAADIAA